MSTTRRDFIINLGISIASLVLTRCASYQDPSTNRLERPSANDSVEHERANLTVASTPTTNLSQKPKPIFNERRSVQGAIRPAHKHTMTPSEWMECDPCNNPSLPAYGRLRLCWENLYLLERHLYDPYRSSVSPREMLIDCHNATLKDLVAMGELSQEGAHEMHEAFLAAIQYVLTNSIEMTCYD